MGDNELPQRLVDFKRKCMTGDYSPLTKFHLSKVDYTRLHDKIQATFRRYNYNPRRQIISICQPPTVHCFFVSFFGSAISDEILKIGHENLQARAFTESIANALSAPVFLIEGDDTWEQRPDAQFEHDKAIHPGRTARRYIYHSDGQIKVVLGIDLNEDKGSTISVWKPTFSPTQNDDVVDMDIGQVVQAQPFRDANKNPVNVPLTLRLHDFAPDSLCQDCPNTAFSIPYRDMSDMLTKAERYELKRARQGVPDSSSRVIRKRRLSGSLEDLFKA
ncbi:hypothetical protein FBULB1_2193 [Fusarium bulbicola]|nr:hypothetical protein FBULB1_2193 [Fusarium bulbicola]